MKQNKNAIGKSTDEKIQTIITQQGFEGNIQFATDPLNEKNVLSFVYKLFPVENNGQKFCFRQKYTGLGDSVSSSLDNLLDNIVQGKHDFLNIEDLDIETFTEHFNKYIINGDRDEFFKEELQLELSKTPKQMSVRELVEIANEVFNRVTDEIDRLYFVTGVSGIHHV